MVFFETLLTVATEQVGAALLTGINAKLNPKDIELFLKQAIKTANDGHPKLFSAHGYQLKPKQADSARD
jgi:hypothetical protein